MPRRLRLHVPGGFYHVTLRGNHREALFDCTADRRVLNDIVAEVIAQLRARIHAFCWMTNHLHAMIEVGEQPLGEVMKRIAMRYSRYRHKALETAGHLFERRHGASLIDADAYLLGVLRYIHLNPVKAGMVSDPAEYPWTSHRAYLGVQTISWLTTDRALSLFADDRNEASSAYAAFIRAGIAEDLRDPAELAGCEDSRVVGDDDFVAGLALNGGGGGGASGDRGLGREGAEISDSPPRGDRGDLDSHCVAALDRLARDVAAAHGVLVDALRSRVTSSVLIAARRELARRAVESGVAGVSQVARFLGRDASSVSRWLRKRCRRREA